VEARFSAPVQTGPGAHPASCTMGTGSFPRVKSGQGVTLTPHPLLVPWSRKSTAIPLLPLWAVRPVQSLSACTRVHFTFSFLLYILTRFITHFSLGYLNKGSLYCCLSNTSNTSIRKILCSTDFLYACIKGDISTNTSQISADIASNLTT